MVVKVIEVIEAICKKNTFGSLKSVQVVDEVMFLQSHLGLPSINHMINVEHGLLLTQIIN